MKIWLTPTTCPTADINRCMIEGFQAHADDVVFDSADFDIACFWSMHKQRHIAACKRKKKRFLLMERAYLGDRFHWTSLGFDGLNGMADFCNDDVPDDRWRQYWADSVKPWRSGGDYALVIGQVPHDASLRGANVYEWAANACRDALEVYGRVVFRPHPLDRHKRNIKGAEYHTGDLAEAFAGAACVVTYCSNTAVESVMEGIPTVAYDAMSMAYSVTSRSVKDALITPDRNDWGRKLAYCQWLPEEIESGAAWAHLRRYVYGSK
jgi:hypothetical protein